MWLPVAAQASCMGPTVPVWVLLVFSLLLLSPKALSRVYLLLTFLPWELVQALWCWVGGHPLRLTFFREC